MKKSIKTVLILQFVFTLFFAISAYALALQPDQVLLMNSMARYFDARPEGPALRELQAAIKSENPALRGLAAIVLYKHFGKRFQALLLRNFTLNLEIDQFKQEKSVLVKLNDVNKLLDSFSSAVNQLKDERVQRLFLFFHLRQKNVWLLSQSAERLSLAVFYRIGTFDGILGEKLDPIRLAALADKKK